MSKNVKMRVSDAPISFEGMERVDPDDIGAFDRYDFNESPTLNHAVEITGESLGQLESWAGGQGQSFNLQDPQHRDKREQIEQTLSGYATEMAVMFLSEELGLAVEWLEDDSGYCGDALLMPEVGENYTVEIKCAQMSSAGQNVPHRGSYDSTPREGWKKEGMFPDVLVFGYVLYTGNSLIVAVEGCEPFDEDLNGILSREPETKCGGNLWVYDRKFIRHGIEQIDSVLLEKLRK